MADSVMVALITLGGTALGTFGGIFASTKLIAYRIEQLERKVEKHNGVIERTFVLEGQMKEVQHDIRDMKEGY